MGISSDAIFGWGLAFDQEFSMYVEDEHDHESWDSLYDQLHKQGIELGTHCSSEYPMLYLAVQSTKQTAWRGHVMHPDAKEPTAEVVKKLLDAAELVRASFPDAFPEALPKPGWFLVSYLG